tara:strand:+ start:133966 stop:134553 length:588 start_codon:yes stop_codon:yes gene_type:complete
VIHFIKYLGFIILATTAFNATAIDKEITEESFKCLSEMTPVRSFFVDNLHGNLDATLDAANNEGGAVYPAGSVVQLIPTEVMVKRDAGFNAATKDWEFFELDVNDGKSAIRARGFTDVVNRFGGNCFDCHVKARPEFDLICETGHGCDPIPLTPVMVRAIQKTDPRCATQPELTAEEAEMLKVIKSFMDKKEEAS